MFDSNNRGLNYFYLISAYCRFNKLNKVISRQRNQGKYEKLEKEARDGER